MPSALLRCPFVFSVLALVAGVIVAAGWGAAAIAGANASAFDFTFQSIDGREMPLAQYRGKALLIVNTASFCGFTRQYQGLQALHERYSAQGLVVIGVPSNDFGGQEPKAESEIRQFCRGAFGVTFPLTSKLHVTGAGAHPLYRWTAKRLGREGVPRWNFTKLLIDRQGQPVQAFPSGIRPLSDTLLERVESVLTPDEGG